jgi:hypothetical protein
VFERFTESARRVLFFARYEAGRAGAASIEPDHLLFGLLRDTDTVARRVLERHRLDVQRLHHQLEARGGDTSALPPSAEITFSAASKRTLDLADEEADRIGLGHVGSEHVLLALLRDPDSSAGRLLQEYGLRLHDVRNTVLQLGAETGHPEPLGAPPTPSNWRRITDYVPSDQVHIEYSTAKPEDRPWRNVAGVRWGAYGYTIGELVEMAWDAVATVAAGVDEKQRYDVQLVLTQPEPDEKTAARVRAAIESQLGVTVERGVDGGVSVRARD